MGDEKIESFIANFSCSKDEDIEYFIKNKAISFERKGKARTFIIFDEDANDVSKAILGYFTLAITVLEVPETLSNMQRKKLDGMSAKKYGTVLKSFPAILIGQFAKNDFACNSFSGDLLMSFCFSKILEGQKILGGRVLLVECKNVTKLLDFYSEYGFNVIAESNGDNKLLVLNRILTDDEIVTRI